MSENQVCKFIDSIDSEFTPDGPLNRTDTWTLRMPLKDHVAQPLPKTSSKISWTFQFETTNHCPPPNRLYFFLFNVWQRWASYQKWSFQLPNQSENNRIAWKQKSGPTTNSVRAFNVRGSVSGTGFFRCHLFPLFFRRCAFDFREWTRRHSDSLPAEFQFSSFAYFF